jgi:hypothetical protein
MRMGQEEVQVRVWARCNMPCERHRQANLDGSRSGPSSERRTHRATRQVHVPGAPENRGRWTDVSAARPAGPPGAKADSNLVPTAGKANLVDDHEVDPEQVVNDPAQHLRQPGHSGRVRSDEGCGLSLATSADITVAGGITLVSTRP